MRAAVILAAGALLVLLTIMDVHGSKDRRDDDSPCEPNPCRNGGTCVPKRGKRFRCQCPEGFFGRRCQKSSVKDCYNGNGESYRGTARQTEGGRRCLPWKRSFIKKNMEDPFDIYSDFNGLKGRQCRNPDGDVKPWCFYNDRRQLKWDYCDIKQCSPSTPTVTNPPSTVPFSRCGMTNADVDPKTKIVGGTESDVGSHPWQVSLKVKNGEFGGHICGGILLSSCWVLTAAHCLDSSSEYEVEVGGSIITSPEATEQIIDVEEVIIHENYDDNTLKNDIALLRLEAEDGPYCAKETDFVKSVCLPQQQFPAGKKCTISGWGATGSESYSPTLMEAQVFLISNERCTSPEVYGNEIEDGMLCAGLLQGGVDSCQGDSGGPLVCWDKGVNYITGVVSWGYGCAERNKPGVYTNVYSYLDWIKSKMN